MKAYTDLNQSEKLAEILPIESADMFWLVVGNTPRVHVLTEPLSNYNKWESYPCWSLAALLNILPSSTLDSSDDHHYRLHCNEKFTEWYDNPIDACVEMIDRLHEQMIYDFNNS